MTSTGRLERRREIHLRARTTASLPGIWKGALPFLKAFLVAAVLLGALSLDHRASATEPPVPVDKKPKAYTTYAKKMGWQLYSRIPKRLGVTGGEYFGLPFFGASLLSKRPRIIFQYWETYDYEPWWAKFLGGKDKYRYPNGRPCSSMRTFRSCRLLLLTNVDIRGLYLRGAASYMATFRSVRSGKTGRVPRMVSLEKLGERWTGGSSKPPDIAWEYYRCPGLLTPCR